MVVVVVVVVILEKVEQMGGRGGRKRVPSLLEMSWLFNWWADLNGDWGGGDADVMVLQANLMRNRETPHRTF